MLYNTQKEALDKYREISLAIHDKREEIHVLDARRKEITLLVEVPLRHCGASGHKHLPHKQVSSLDGWFICPGDDV